MWGALTNLRKLSPARAMGGSWMEMVGGVYPTSFSLASAGAGSGSADFRSYAFLTPLYTGDEWGDGMEILVRTKQ